jgi:hypothetical protein
MSRDGYVLLSGHLDPEQAGMAAGLLESAGIEAVVEDANLSGVNPFLRVAISGAKLLVPAADAERAGEILRAGGLLPGGAAEPIEIPEEEWSRPAPGPDAPAPAAGPGPFRRAFLAVAVGGGALWLILRGCAAG